MEKKGGLSGAKRHELTFNKFAEDASEKGN